MQEALFFGAGAGKNTVAFGFLRQNLVKYELRNSCSNWLGDKVLESAKLRELF